MKKQYDLYYGSSGTVYAVKGRKAYFVSSTGRLIPTFWHADAKVSKMPGYKNHYESAKSIGKIKL